MELSGVEEENNRILQSLRGIERQNAELRLVKKALTEEMNTCRQRMEYAVKEKDEAHIQVINV